MDQKAYGMRGRHKMSGDGWGGGVGRESKDSHLEVERTNTSQKSWNENLFKDQTEEKSEPKKDPNLQSNQAEHVPGNIDERKMTRVEKNSHGFEAEKLEKQIPYNRTSPRLALGFAWGAICNTTFLKAVEPHLCRILRNKLGPQRILSLSHSLLNVKATGDVSRCSEA